MQVFIVDYAYGFHAQTCEPDYVAKLRSTAALRTLQKYPGAHIVLSAGMKRQTGDCGPLAQMMKKFLMGEGVSAEKILLNPRGHDTLSETVAAHGAIQKYADDTKIKIICTTSAFHAPRVWCIWLLRYGIAPTLYISHLKPRAVEYLYELLKIPRDIVRSLLRL